MNLKEILTSMLEYLGEEPSDNYTANPDVNYKRLLSIANASLADISQAHTWSILKKTHTINIVDGVNLYALPTDFDRLIDDTTYTNNYEVDLPTSDAVIAYNNYYGSNYNYQGRLVDDQLEFINVPESELTFNYVSRHYVKSQGGDLKEKFTDDYDTTVFDDELLIRSIRQRYREQVGEPSNIDAQDLSNRLRHLKIADVGAKSFNVNQDRNDNYFPFKRK